MGPPPPAYIYPGVVTRVVDGDTLDAVLVMVPQKITSLDGRDTWDFGFRWYGSLAYAPEPEQHEVRIRLLAMDAPDKDNPAAQQAATQALAALAGPRENVVVQSRKLDSFGRSLATVWRARDGLCVNDEMVRLGHAKPYKGD